jgi:hypothetical protein
VAEAATRTRHETPRAACGSVPGRGAFCDPCRSAARPALLLLGRGLRPAHHERPTLDRRAGRKARLVAGHLDPENATTTREES